MDQVTDQQHIDLINYSVTESITPGTEWNELTSVDNVLSDLGLDSLDFMIMFIYIGDLTFVAEHVWSSVDTDDLSTMKVSELIKFVKLHQSRPSDVSVLTNG